MKIDFFKKIIILVFFITLWTIGSKMNLWNKVLIPSPEKVIQAFIELINNQILIKSIFVSFFRIITGSLISIFLGIVLGIIFGIYPKLYIFFKMPLEMLKNIPPLALMPLIILWFGIGETPKIIIIFLASFFPIFFNTMKGVRNCDEKLIEVGKIFKMSDKEILKKIRIPNAIPDILVGIKLALTYSWRAIIGAEMIASSSGLGHLILEGQILFRPDIIVVGIITIGTLGALTDFTVSKVINKFLRRTYNENEKGSYGI